MRKSFYLIIGLFLFATSLSAQDHKMVVKASKPGAEIKPTMYGVFFEDINFAADGGLYAEMVENRSFESPQNLQGWDAMGKVVIGETDPAFPRNPRYASMLYSGHKDKHTGMTNRGYFGMGLKKDSSYDFTVYARKNDKTSSEAKFKVELLDKYQNVLSSHSFTVTSGDWGKYSATLTSTKTTGEGHLRLVLETKEGVDVDYVSLFPQDNWNGLRPDLVQALADLTPGVFRFPGGCIIEGSDLDTRYQWKNTLGPAENRPMNENRWNNTYTTKYAPSYYQSYGLGFYEYFLLCEKIGAAPLPVISVGLACQFHNDDISAHVPVEDLGPYVQDALDLIEFANGPVTSAWGKVRAEMGHPAPFNLKHLAIGNEQWGEIYPERLEVFMKAIQKQYPDILIIGSAGPMPSGKDFDYGWKEMNRLKVDLVDEHYYCAPGWFLANAERYDNYDRKGSKVFAGEYACHIVGREFTDPSIVDQMLGGGRAHGAPGTVNKPADHRADALAAGPQAQVDSRAQRQMSRPENGPFFKNNFWAALTEAAFMTGLERNADVVWMATYAPLFAHAEGYQWDPDLIWFDNLNVVRTPSYYVQQMYGNNPGTNVLSITENGKNVVGEDGIYASAALDSRDNDYIIKIVNTGDSDKKVSITFDGIKKLGSGILISLHVEDTQYNSIENKDTVAPVTSQVSVDGNVLEITIPAKTFQLYRF